MVLVCKCCDFWAFISIFQIRGSGSFTISQMSFWFYVLELMVNGIQNLFSRKAEQKMLHVLFILEVELVINSDFAVF